MRRDFKLTSAWALVPVAALLTLTVVLFAAVPALRQGKDADASGSLSKILGDWEGESICVDKNRPACKNEHVVYHIKKKDGETDTVMLAADKIINGKPEEMGVLECKYDASKSTLTCEFTVNSTHGVFEFTVKGDAMDGTLKILPAGTLGRRINVKRAPADAPPPK
jgi:hypothetical protein